MASQSVASVQHEHDPLVAHHFETWEQEHSANVLGMWIFLATEVMLFGGMFLAYTIYSITYPGVFQAAAEHQNLLAGSINTVVLLVSSLFMALSVRSAQLGDRKATRNFLLITAALGALFIGIKFFEYYQHWQEQLVPGLNYNYPGADAPRASLFFFLYFVMTGLHAIHLTIGVGLVLVVSFLVHRGKFMGPKYTSVDMLGLYWHFVDVVWLFLFPMLYLIARH